MPEATMILIDNSEYMRNGDYQPTRFDAQSDAVTSVFQAKTDSNPENLVGLMTMAGKGPEVLVTNSKDLGQILDGIHTATGKVEGTADLATAISVAQLALKHRQDKNLRQRIIALVGSPLVGEAAEQDRMVKLAKRLKKNNVAVDVVAFGEGVDENNSSILKAFVDNANSSDNSHFLAAPPGLHLLSDMINSSPILAEDRGNLAGGFAEAGPSTAGAAGGFEFGVDPSIDPELAMALRMSMEEEQARQAAAAQAEQTGNATASGSEPAPAPTSASAPPPAVTTEPAEPTEEEEEALLKQAIALSQGEDVEMTTQDADGDEEMDEEEAIARAIQMSMEGQQQGEKKDEAKKQ